MARSVTKPDQFATEVAVATSAPPGKVGLDFGFDANQLVVLNDKAADVYLSLDSTAGSTDGLRVKASETISLSSLKLGAMSLATTTTTTGDLVRVGAWSW